MSAITPIFNHGNASHLAAATPITRSDASFADLVDRESVAQEKRTAMREAAEQLVSTAFITPILGALRENSTAAGPFAPSTAEKRFGPLLDQQFADRIVQAANFSLIDTIIDRYLPREVPKQGRMLERTLA